MNEEIAEAISAMLENGFSWAGIAKQYGKHPEAVRSSYRRHLKERADSTRSAFCGITRAFGGVSDTHLCSKFAREDALRDLYAIFQGEGIDTVVHAGNLVDGYIPRINGGSVKYTSIDDQTKYVIDNYPLIDGIRTIYITGDDHEGWWQKEGFNWGEHLELMAVKSGRTDLKYAGHIESDLHIKGQGNHPAIVRLQHPGGGSAYARSYKAQKQIESYEGGEKPAILIQGHYHIANFMPERNVFTINLPGLQDQTIFGRKKMLRMEVGGAIIRVGQDAIDGHVSRCSVEFIMFYNRGYYKSFLTSDDILKTERIVI